MKKYILFLTLATVTTLMAGCSKDTKCKCSTTEDKPEVTYINVNNGVSCSNITKLGFEEQVEGHFVRTLKDVVCEKVKE